MLTKSKAKETLQLNFKSLERAAEKLSDQYLLESFTVKGYPVTYKVAEYLESLDNDISQLENICSTCGIKYHYTPMCTSTDCRYCNHRDQFKDNMIIEPDTVEELLVNLHVLADVFDHEESKYYYKDEIDHWVSYEAYKNRPKELSLGQFE